MWIKVAVQKNSQTKESIEASLNEYPLFDSESRSLSYTVSAVMKSSGINNVYQTCLLSVFLLNKLGLQGYA